MNQLMMVAKKMIDSDELHQLIIVKYKVEAVVVKGENVHHFFGKNEDRRIAILLCLTKAIGSLTNQK